MKKLLSLLVTVAFVGGVVGLASAQAPAPKAEEKKPAEKMDKAADKAGKKAEKKPAAKNASGTVKSAGADSIVVAGKEKGKEAEWTFAVDPSTKIKRAGKDVMAADIKPGDSVQVRYSEKDGKMVAQSVTVKGGGQAKKAEGDSMKPAGEKKAANPCAAKPAEKKQ